MKKVNSDELRPEYNWDDFGHGIRGIYYDDHKSGRNLVLLSPDVASFFPDEEAVNNARKHAAAPNIWVQMKQIDPGLVLLEILDDVVGFDVDAINTAYDKRGSLGMVNLRERTELVNGLLNIQSQPGKGTHIQVYVPLTEEAADRLHHARH